MATQRRGALEGFRDTLQANRFKILYVLGLVLAVSVPMTNVGLV